MDVPSTLWSLLITWAFRPFSLSVLILSVRIGKFGLLIHASHNDLFDQLLNEFHNLHVCYSDVFYVRILYPWELQTLRTLCDPTASDQDSRVCRLMTGRNWRSSRWNESVYWTASPPLPVWFVGARFSSKIQLIRLQLNNRWTFCSASHLTRPRKTPKKFNVLFFRPFVRVVVFCSRAPNKSVQRSRVKCHWIRAHIVRPMRDWLQSQPEIRPQRSCLLWLRSHWPNHSNMMGWITYVRIKIFPASVEPVDFGEDGKFSFRLYDFEPNWNGVLDDCFKIKID